MSNPLTFVYQPISHSPNRMVYLATDPQGYLYTVGVDIPGTNGFVAVYDSTNLEPVYGKAWFDCRIHADELKRHLQGIADLLADPALAS